MSSSLLLILLRGMNTRFREIPDEYILHWIIGVGIVLVIFIYWLTIDAKRKERKRHKERQMEIEEWKRNQTY
jgi:cytochrome b561